MDWGEALRDCSDSTVWEELRVSRGEDNDSLTCCIMDYIKFCVDNTVPTRTELFFLIACLRRVGFVRGSWPKTTWEWHHSSISLVVMSVCVEYVRDMKRIQVRGSFFPVRSLFLFHSFAPSLSPLPLSLCFSRVKEHRVFISINNDQSQTPCKQTGQAGAELQQQGSCHAATRHPEWTATLDDALWWMMWPLKQANQDTVDFIDKTCLWLLFVASETVCENNVWEHLQEKIIGTYMCCCSNYQGHNV